MAILDLNLQDIICVSFEKFTSHKKEAPPGCAGPAIEYLNSYKTCRLNHNFEFKPLRIRTVICKSLLGIAKIVIKSYVSPRTELFKIGKLVRKFNIIYSI